MGKKKIVQKTTEEILKEGNKREGISGKVAISEKVLAQKKLDTARVYINASYNNTIITISDRAGNVITWASSGSLGFYGPKKATPFAASKIVSALAEKLKKIGVFNISIIVKGVGSGRDSAIRSLAGHGFNILSIKDATPVPHNGPKPRKVRRV